jgi:hypothetical protein
MVDTARTDLFCFGTYDQCHLRCKVQLHRLICPNCPDQTVHLPLIIFAEPLLQYNVVVYICWPSLSTNIERTICYTSTTQYGISHFCWGPFGPQNTNQAYKLIPCQHLKVTHALKQARVDQQTPKIKTPKCR